MNNLVAYIFGAVVILGIALIVAGVYVASPVISWVMFTLGTVAAVAAVAWLIQFLTQRGAAVADTLNEWLHRKELRAIERRKALAEAVKLENEAGAAAVVSIVAEAGQQVHIRDAASAYWRAAHTDSRRYSNGPATDRNPTTAELAAWAAWHESHGKRQPQITVENPHPMELDAGPPPLLPKLIPAQRLIIAGGSDSGKSTLAKHLIAGRVDHSKIIVLDPHAPSKIMGIDCIGAGRRFEKIVAALESLLVLMDARYKDIEVGLFRYSEHDRITVVLDEYTALIEKYPDAADMIKTLLIESRKVNIHLVILAHSTTVESLGIDAQIRRSATIVEIFGGNNIEERRVFIHPSAKIGPDGKRVKPTEYALPGPFVEYPKPAGEVVHALPDARIIRADLMDQAGESVTAICQMYHDIDYKPNSTQRAEVKQLLSDIREARKQATVEGESTEK